MTEIELNFSVENQTEVENTFNSYCRKCGNLLTIENWYEAYKKYPNRICINCVKIQNSQRYAEKHSADNIYVRRKSEFELKTKNISEKDLAYIAAILDSEGCINIAKSIKYNKHVEYFLQITVTNTDKRLIDWLYKTTELGFTKTSPPRSSNHNIRYDWVISSYKGSLLLEKLLPYSLIKKEQIQIALEFANLPKLSKYRYSRLKNEDSQKEYEQLKLKQEVLYQKIKSLHGGHIRNLVI